MGTPHNVTATLPDKQGKQDFIISVMIFLFSPIMGVLITLNKIRHNLNYLYLIGVAFSLFGAFLPPTSDAYRYRLQFLRHRDFAFDMNMLFSDAEHKDFLFGLTSHLSHYVGCTYEVYKFIILLTCYTLYIWMFNDIVKHHPKVYTGKRLFFAVVALIFSIRLFTIVSGIRFGFASTIIIVGIYLIYKQKIWKGIILIGLSISMHFSMLLVGAIILSGYIIKQVQIRPVILLSLFVILLIFSSTVIGDILVNLFPDNELVSRKVNGYIEGQWGSEAMMSTFSVGGFIFTMIRIIPVIPLALWAIFNKQPSFLKNCGLLMTALLCISLSSFTLLMRYGNIATAIFFIWLLNNPEDISAFYQKLKIATLTFLIVFGSYVYSQRKVLTTTTMEYAVLLSPILLIVEHTYTSGWISSHIGSDGELK